MFPCKNRQCGSGIWKGVVFGKSPILLIIPNSTYSEFFSKLNVRLRAVRVRNLLKYYKGRVPRTRALFLLGGRRFYSYPAVRVALLNGEVVLSASLSGGGAFLHYEGMAEVPGHVPGIAGRIVRGLPEEGIN